MHIEENHTRSVVKGLSWRIVGTLDTIAISYVITGEATMALSIGGIELFSKIFLYYLHERAWIKISWGKRNTNPGYFTDKTYVEDYQPGSPSKAPNATK